jgi:formylglycine-generating enzyme required for sulfatase activity
LVEGNECGAGLSCQANAEGENVCVPEQDDDDAGGAADSGVSDAAAPVDEGMMDAAPDAEIEVDASPPPPAACEPDCPDLDWVPIEGGRFLMGMPGDESGNSAQPQHEVTVPDFEISRTEVTVGQYRVCFEAGVCTEPDPRGQLEFPDCYWWHEVTGREDSPVNCISWNQARAFARWVGGDLLSESEWEFAARNGGREITYPWGDEEATCERAVMRDPVEGCEENTTWPVCSKPAGNTPDGICDLAGNVAEWILDEVHNYADAPTDGSPFCETPDCLDESVRRVTRGGSFRDIADYLHARRRSSSRADRRGSIYGIRVRRAPR